MVEQFEAISPSRARIQAELRPRELSVRDVDIATQALRSRFSPTFDSATRVVLSDPQMSAVQKARAQNKKSTRGIVHGSNRQTRKELTVRSTGRHRAAHLHLRVRTLEEQTFLRRLAQKNARRKSHRRLPLRRHRPRTRQNRILAIPVHSPSAIVPLPTWEGVRA